MEWRYTRAILLQVHLHADGLFPCLTYFISQLPHLVFAGAQAVRNTWWGSRDVFKLNIWLLTYMIFKVHSKVGLPWALGASARLPVDKWLCWMALVYSFLTVTILVLHVRMLALDLFIHLFIDPCGVSQSPACLNRSSFTLNSLPFLM